MSTTNRTCHSAPRGLRLAGALLLITLVALGGLHAPATRGQSGVQAAVLVLGQPDFTSNGIVTPSRLTGPGAVTLDPLSGRVFVADTENQRVLRYAALSALGNGAAPEAVLGQPGFTTQTPATTARGMSLPGALALDSAGRLWVADTANSRVLRFDNAASKPSGAAADGVLGQGNFSSFVPETSSLGMREPADLAVDAEGRFWVADASNNRVLLFDPALTTAPRIYLPAVRRPGAHWANTSSSFLASSRSR